MTFLQFISEDGACTTGVGGIAGAKPGDSPPVSVIAQKKIQKGKSFSMLRRKIAGV